jgi:hypothetical protein
MKGRGNLCDLDVPGDNTKTDLEEIACGSVYWIHLAHSGILWRAVVKTVNLR